MKRRAPPDVEKLRASFPRLFAKLYEPSPPAGEERDFVSYDEPFDPEIFARTLRHIEGWREARAFGPVVELLDSGFYLGPFEHLTGLDAGRLIDALDPHPARR